MIGDGGKRFEFPVCFGDRCFAAELADTSWKKALGLMFRNKLDRNSGMLFRFRKEKRVAVWTPFVCIPLDIFWMNANREIVHIERNVPASRWLGFRIFRPRDGAKYIFETNAGVADELGVREGTKAEFK